LTIIGQGMDQGCFEQMRADPSVHFAGFVEDVVPWYHRSGVSVVPLRVGSGTRLKILEAMSTGNPVVSTHRGAEGIEATSGENILIADDPMKFAEAVLRLRSAPEEFEKIRKKARTLVQRKYDWRVIGRRLSQAIHSFSMDR
jgi:glycosyltransferase involved in cell wall biosynthesis